MQCPYCGVIDSKVVDSRSSENDTSVRRRRECNACERRFTTFERIERRGRLVVIKRDGRRVPFSNDKILNGIRAACGKLPISEEVKLEIVRQVDDLMHRSYEREVESLKIGHEVARYLRGIDQIAFVRHASEYLSFESIEDIEEVIQELRESPPAVEGQSELFPSE